MKLNILLTATAMWATAGFSSAQDFPSVSDFLKKPAADAAGYEEASRIAPKLLTGRKFVLRFDRSARPYDVMPVGGAARLVGTDLDRSHDDLVLGPRKTRCAINDSSSDCRRPDGFGARCRTIDPSTTVCEVPYAGPAPMRSIEVTCTVQPDRIDSYSKDGVKHEVGEILVCGTGTRFAKGSAYRMDVRCELTADGSSSCKDFSDAEEEGKTTTTQCGAAGAAGTRECVEFYRNASNCSAESFTVDTIKWETAN